MEPLLLVAAGGLAREAAAIVAQLPQYTLTGCLDDDPGLWGTSVGTLPVLGALELSVRGLADHRLLICAGRGAARRGIESRLAALGVPRSRYATVVDPSVHVPLGCTVGEGSLLMAQAVLTADVTVGCQVVVMPHCTLTHDDVLADYVTLASAVSLAGDVRVGEAAYLGTNSAVREHVRIGAECVLGMGAVLTRDQPAGETWAGCPARRLGASANT